jgi:DNA-binding NarL/FixJ family response regulator
MDARRVVLAEADPMLRSALRLLLSYDGNVELVGEAADAETLVALLATVPTDVLLVDWDLPGWRPECMQHVYPATVVVGLGMRPERRARVLEEGAHAFVSTLDSPLGLIAALSDTRRCDPN